MEKLPASGLHLYLFRPPFLACLFELSVSSIDLFGGFFLRQWQPVLLLLFPIVQCRPQSGNQMIFFGFSVWFFIRVFFLSLFPSSCTVKFFVFLLISRLDPGCRLFYVQFLIKFSKMIHLELLDLICCYCFLGLLLMNVVDARQVLFVVPFLLIPITILSFNPFDYVLFQAPARVMKPIDSLSLIGVGFEKIIRYSFFIVVPTFDTKVTEYLCSGWVFFFLQTNFDFLTSHLWRNFFYIIRKVLLSWAQIWKYISPVIIFCKVMGV